MQGNSQRNSVCVERVPGKVEEPAGSLCNPFVWNHPQDTVERFMLTVAMTGGKNAENLNHIKEFIDELCAFGAPVQSIRRIRETPGHYYLLNLMLKHRIGKYTLMSRMLRDIAECPVSVTSLSRDALCSITGFAMKSASLFKLYSDPAARVAVLDKHTLEWLGRPQPKTDDQYLSTELLLLERADAEGLHPALLNFQLWYSSKPRHIWRRCLKSMTDARRYLARQNETNNYGKTTD